MEAYVAAFQNGTYECLDTRTVADVLDPPAQRAGLDLPPYDPSDEPRPAMRPRGYRGCYRSAAEVEALLAPFIDDAIAGVPDRWIARRTGLSAQQVKQWRSRRRIRGRRGRLPAELGARFLLASFLGESTEPVPHEVSPVGGAWRPPAYVLRRPLQYDAFVRAVRLLAGTMTTEEIALGIGIDERDVEIAVTLGVETRAA